MHNRKRYVVTEDASGIMPFISSCIFQKLLDKIDGFLTNRSIKTINTNNSTLHAVLVFYKLELHALPTFCTFVVPRPRWVSTTFIHMTIFHDSSFSIAKINFCGITFIFRPL